MASDALEAVLEIPPAQIHVIGDEIPLIWTFSNRTDRAMALLWEGCCRLNGRLEVSRAEAPLEMLPPGSSLAHRFARAEPILPGTARSFRTLLGDWVKLRDSGSYVLRGYYQGILPNQQPQIPRGMQLWRGSTSTHPKSIEVLAPLDYLQTRPLRTAATETSVELTGERRLLPVGETRFQIAFRHDGQGSREWIWPDDCQLWFLDNSGHRAERSPRRIGARTERLFVRSGEMISREFVLTPAIVEGLPWDDYSLFVDLSDSRMNSIRMPSNSIKLNWRWDPSDLTRLLNDAARGPAIGQRNISLKMLRLYLGETTGLWSEVPAEILSPEARILAADLRLANCLRPLAPRPGPIELNLEVTSHSVNLPASWLECFESAGSLTNQLGKLFGIRRHLGWEVNLQFQPQPDVTMGRLAAMVSAWGPYLEQLGASQNVLLTAGGITNRAMLALNTQPQGIVVQVETADAAIRFSSRKAKNGFPRLTHASIEDLRTWLERESGSSDRVRLELASSLRWAKIEPLVQTIIRGRPMTEIGVLE